MAVSNPSPALLAAAVQPLQPVQPAEMPQRACRWQACAVPLACVALLALAGPWWSDYLSGLVVKTMILAIFALSLQLLRSEEHTSELQSQSNLVCRLLLEKKKKI